MTASFAMAVNPATTMSKNIHFSSFEKLLTRARERHYFKGASVLCFIKLTDGLSAEDLQAKGDK